jgi:hypothetical protein
MIQFGFALFAQESIYTMLVAFALAVAGQSPHNRLRRAVTYISATTMRQKQSLAGSHYVCILKN